VEDAKSKVLNAEKRSIETIAEMEKKLNEEKYNILNECNLKMRELSVNAHKIAVEGLDKTTKDAYKENMRLSEDLKYHVEERTELNKLNTELLGKNQELLEKTEFQSVIVKEKVVQAIAYENLVYFKFNQDDQPQTKNSSLGASIGKSAARAGD
jgi:hypothetical protein